MTIGSEIERHLKNNLELASGPTGPSNSGGHTYAKIPEWQLRQWLEATGAISEVDRLREILKRCIPGANAVDLGGGQGVIALYLRGSDGENISNLALPPITEPGHCPFCGRDPFHRSDMGEPLAVDCCELGDALFRGARATPETVTIEWEDFVKIANRLRVAPAGPGPGFGTWADLSQVLTDLYEEIGCAHDNEAALVAISTMVDLLRLGATDMTTAGRYAWKQQVDAFLECMSRREPESDVGLRDRLLQAPGVDPTDRGVQYAIGEALDKIAAIHGIERYVPTGKIRPNASLPMEPPTNNVPDK